jgi:hypothetical protein
MRVKTDGRIKLPSMLGMSSLLVMFAVLCLTVFAVLSVATVQANTGLLEKMNSAVSEYYLADCEAEQILAQLRNNTIPAEVEVNGDTYSYLCRVNETQALAVEVEICADAYKILRWQLISVGEWQADDKRPVWGGK